MQTYSSGEEVFLARFLSIKNRTGKYTLTHLDISVKCEEQKREECREISSVLIYNQKRVIRSTLGFVGGAGGRVEPVDDVAAAAIIVDMKCCCIIIIIMEEAMGLNSAGLAGG